MAQGKTNVGGAAAGLGAAAVLAACFMSADHKRGLTCDEAAERGYICEPGAGVAGGGGSVSGTAGAPVMGAGGASGLGGGGAGGGGAGGGGAGGGPVCTAPEVDCGGTCVDLTASDAANCGACGRSCLGTATCAAGACVPEAMATNEVAPYALAQDEASLYWASPAIKDNVAFSRLRRVPKATAGGSATNAFASTIVRARSLGFDGTKLYWGDLGASPSDGNQRLFSGVPGNDPTTFELGQLGVQHLALAGTKIYWTLTGSSALRGRPLTAGAGAFDPNVFDQVNPGWLAVDADVVPYWVAIDPAGTGREVRRTVSPSTAEPVATGPDVVAVELTADRYYWADRAAGTVRSRPKATPTEAPREEFSGQGAVEGFRLEASSGAVTLYVLTAQGRQLKAWRKGPDEAAPLLLGEVTAKADPYGGNPFGAAYVLTDAQYLYFADVGTLTGATPDFVSISAGDGVVYRVAK